MIENNSINNGSYGMQAKRDINIIIESLSLDLSNVKEIFNQSETTAKESTISFFKQLLSFLEKEGSPSIINKFSTPNNALLLNEAFKVVSSNNITEKRIILCNLLFDKLKQDITDDSDDKYKLVIEAMNKLSLNKIKLLALIEIRTKILPFINEYDNNMEIDKIVSFINNIDKIATDDFYYLTQLGLFYSLYPYEFDINGSINKLKDSQKSVFTNLINEINSKNDSLNFNLYSLSQSGHEIAKVYINNILDFNYLISSEPSLKPMDLHLQNLTVEQNIEAGGDIAAFGGVAAKSTIKNN